MYIEELIILDYIFDFIILFSINLILKNNISLKRLLLGSLYSLLLIPLIFIKLPNIINILIRLLFGLSMVIVTFKYKNISYTMRNLIFLYMISTLIAGFLYYLSLEINYHIILIVLVPFYLYLIYFMLKQERRIKKYLFDLEITIKNHNIKLNSYLDTGNSVKDYVLKNRMIIVSKPVLNHLLDNELFYYINIHTINGNELIRCYKVDEIKVNNNIINKCVIGVTNNLNNTLYDALLPNYLEEELC